MNYRTVNINLGPYDNRIVMFNELTLFQGGNDVGTGSCDTVLRALQRVCLESDCFCVCSRSDSGSIEYVSRLLFTHFITAVMVLSLFLLLY